MDDGTIEVGNLFYMGMKKQLAINTNKHLIDPEKRRKDVLRSVIDSSRIEGVVLSEDDIRAISDKVEKRLGKRTK